MCLMFGVCLLYLCMIELNIYKVKSKRGTSVVSISDDNRMYFSAAARGMFDVEDVYLNLATSSEEGVLYLLLSNSDDDNALKMTKMGYLNAKNFINEMESSFVFHKKYKLEKLAELYEEKQVYKLTYFE